MKVLFVSAVLPFPLYSGGQVRVYNLLKLISQKHEISLFSFLREESEKKYFQDLSFCKKIETVYRGHAWQARYVLSSAFGQLPLLYTTYGSPILKEKIAMELSKNSYDLIHIEPGYVWPVVPDTNVPIVLAEHNIEYQIYTSYVQNFPVIPIRPLLSLDVMKMRRVEEETWKKGRHVIAVSDDDATVIRKYNPDVTVVPNGVDIREFPFKPKQLTEKQLVFLFVGNFSWMQNVDAVQFLLKALWPDIQKKYPGSELRLVGKRMRGDLRNAAEGSGATLLENITDITKEYQKADFLLAPIRIGGGTKFKILEAMASGVPVITTSVGAKGLNVENEKDLIIADTPEEKLISIESLIHDRKRRETMVKEARHTIEQYYSWGNISKKLETAWQEAREKSH